MIKKSVKAYAVGRAPDAAEDGRFVVEMPVGAKPVSAAFVNGGMLAINAIVPDHTVPRVPHNVCIVANDQVIDLNIGETLGDLISCVMTPTGQLLHLFPVLPWPTSTIIKAAN